MPHDRDPAHQAEAEYADMQDSEFADGRQPNTFPSGETVRADRRDARSDHSPDRMPTEDEEEAAGTRSADPDVSRAYEEAARRGAEVEGEGSI